jgi:hypothetical protein
MLVRPFVISVPLIYSVMLVRPFVFSVPVPRCFLGHPQVLIVVF